MLNNGFKTFLKNRLIRIFAIILLLILPIIIVMVIFTPIARNKNIQLNYERYTLPENYTEEDIRACIAKMKSSNEFRFYFNALRDSELDEVIDDAVKLLLQTREQKALLNLISIMQEKVIAKSTLFNHLSYPEEYFIRPNDFPQLTNVLQDFIASEFKLSILGLVFKSTYDQKFSFDWDNSARSAAHKLRSIYLQSENLKTKLMDVKSKSVPKRPPAKHPTIFDLKPK